MKKFLTFICSAIVCVFSAAGATRDENSVIRGKNNTVSTQSSRSITNRSAVKKSVAARTAGPVNTLKPRATKQIVTTRTPVRQSVKTQRTSIIKTQNVSARAATTTGNSARGETRTGIEYEQCKTAFFKCMDQFCQLKNDNFRRCSCNDKVFKYQEISDTYQNVAERLTEFTENLDVVGMTADQATAMKTATEGEKALQEDTSTSKQLLQAIMNAIKGEDASVGGKYKSLNSITVSEDMTHAFGMNDYGQLIAAYNGNNLYKAVYPQCRDAVSGDCNTASLQRAVNAYLMAIEQDCNTVESALVNQQRTLKSSKYETSAMLDLARVENRQKHNSDDIATCLANVENAVQNEEVCGEGYHKCLDYGQFIDVTTGAPLTGVKNFYELGSLLTFKSNENIQNQKLSSISSNKNFVNFFEHKTKKFATDALDKCDEKADFVWQQYLDRALLDIYYAQKAKVKQIQDSCLDIVAACYDEQTVAIETAIANLTGSAITNLKPAIFKLTQEMCTDYIESCNKMFADDVVSEYMTKKTKYDSEQNCRQIVQNCFDSFGGPGYENFYSLQGGLISAGKALDWFSLYEITGDPPTETKKVLSKCAQELANTEGCKDNIDHIFGGFDKYGDNEYRYVPEDDPVVINRNLRPHGVASEVYTKIIDNLSIQCSQLHGAFVEARIAESLGYSSSNFCKIANYSVFYDEPISCSGSSDYPNSRNFNYWYNFKTNEDMCPANYSYTVDVQSWGACSCWENGYYRSKNGTIETCQPLLPVKSTVFISSQADPICTEDMIRIKDYEPDVQYSDNWCVQVVYSSTGQLCPTTTTTNQENSTDVLCGYTSDLDKKMICILAK